MSLPAHRIAVLCCVAAALSLALAATPATAGSADPAVAVGGQATANQWTVATQEPRASRGPPTVSTQQVVSPCAAVSPPDHGDPDGTTSDVVGWVDGYWYDEPIDVETADGLDEAERQRLVARTAARVEALRCLTFEELPPVGVESRTQFAATVHREIVNESERSGRLMNAEGTALLLVGTDEDWADVQESVLTGGVGAYYEPDAERITLIVEDAGDAPREHVLAHELVHALQDQRFDLDRFDASLRSEYDAERGVIEGSATRIQRTYATSCARDLWNEDCVEPADKTLPEPADNVGVARLFQAPYFYGPAFVDRVYRRGGWDAVSDLYDDMPEHSLHVVAPETYQTVDVEVPAVEDRSGPAWDRVEAEGRPDYDVVGQAALTTMLVAPSLEPETNGSVISGYSLLNATTQQPSEYDQPETSGWRGDRLVAYSDGDRLGSVWVLDWASGEDAGEFADAYEELVAIRGGEPVDGRDGVYRFADDARFDAAVSVRVRDDRVAIVTAPSVDALSEVHAGAGADGGVDGLPGFGLLAGSLAVLLATLTVARRSESRW